MGPDEKAYCLAENSWSQAFEMLVVNACYFDYILVQCCMVHLR